MFDDEREIASSYGLQFFSTSNMHYYNCNVKFWKILEGSSQSNNILFIIINQIIIAFIIFYTDTYLLNIVKVMHQDLKTTDVIGYRKQWWRNIQAMGSVEAIFFAE